MKNGITLLNTCIFILLVIVFFYFYRSLGRENFDTTRTAESKIPKKIWTYWEGDLPILVQKCIESWIKYNPDYEIIILNKKNLGIYLSNELCVSSGIREDKLDIFKLKHATASSQRFSDYVRLYILPIYGGIWMDASIICQTSLQWVHDKNIQSDFEMVGYFREGFSSVTPMVESWFFACVPDSKFVKDWRDEFIRMTDFENVDDYVKSVLEIGVDVSKMPDYRYNYLAVYLSAQKVLQRPTDLYNIDLITSDDTALKHWIDRGFDSNLGAKDLLERNEMHRDQAIIKIVGVVRAELEKMTNDFNVLF
jgi:hypothetical protein